MPVVLLRENFPAEDAGPLDKTAGTIDFEVTTAEYERKQGDKVEKLPYVLIKIAVTDAEQLKINLSDELASLDLPVSVEINGKLIVDKQKITRNWSNFLHYILPRRYFFFSYVAEINCQFELKPQVPVKPVKPVEPAEQKPPGGAKVPDKQGGPATAKGG